MKKTSIALFLIILSSVTVLAQDKKTRVRAKLRAIVDKKELRLGETFNILITYEVSDWNRTPIQFGANIGQWVFQNRKTLYSYGIVKDSTFSEILGVRKNYPDGKASATRYDLIRMEVKPDKLGTLVIPEFQIAMKRFEENSADTTFDRRNSEFELFFPKTAPIRIEVLPNTKIQTISGAPPPLVGHYELFESISNGPYSVGDTLSYSLTISGSSVGFWLDLPDNVNDKIQIDRKYIEYKDSLSSDGKNTFYKTFYLDVVLRKSGRINLSDFFSWQYVDTSSNELSIIQSKLTLETMPIHEGQTIRNLNNSKSDFLIALDVSESMLIEDYEPTRIGKAIEVAEAFRNTFSQSKLIGFSGSIVNLNNIVLTDSIYTMTERGTAIGDALWLGTQMMNPRSKKVIIIIGDGDNTVGHVSIQKAINYAKTKGVRVYTIGIGHGGQVPFGEDSLGRPYLVENTYSDTALRLLAKETGGLFYYIDDYSDLSEIMLLIRKGINK